MFMTNVLTQDLDNEVIGYFTTNIFFHTLNFKKAHFIHTVVTLEANWAHLLLKPWG